MKRTLVENAFAAARPLSDLPQDDIPGWLERQVEAYRECGLTWLLAHADDGVIWGRFEQGKGLLLSSAVAENISPPLRARTLQQARLFGNGGELLLWKTEEEGWQGRLIYDVTDPEKADWKEALDESRFLWGDHAKPLSDGFTLLEEGAQGLRHVVPLALKEGDLNWNSRPRLVVRHYVSKQGFARIVASRLVTLKEKESAR